MSTKKRPPGAAREKKFRQLRIARIVWLRGARRQASDSHFAPSRGARTVEGATTAHCESCKMRIAPSASNRGLLSAGVAFLCENIHNRTYAGDGRECSDGARIAVIGGSGLYSMEGIRVREEREVPTPWGLPSDPITMADMDGHERCVSAPSRQGTPLPSFGSPFPREHLGPEVARRGADPVGERRGFALRGYAPGEFVLCDNLIDRTRAGRRPTSVTAWSGTWGSPGRSATACAQAIAGVLAAQSHPHHPSGTYVCMEGPAFSTGPNRSSTGPGAPQLIGMTAIPEAKLAREAEMCYATIAMVTDYDCWKDGEESVSVRWWSRR